MQCTAGTQDTLDAPAAVQGGAVVEQGTHEELYAVQDSVYHSLVQLQEQATDRRDALAAAAVDLESAAAADEEEAAGIAAQHAAQQLPVHGSGSGLGASLASRGSGRRTSSQLDASGLSKRKGEKEAAGGKGAGGKGGGESGEADEGELVCACVHTGIHAA